MKEVVRYSLEMGECIVAAEGPGVMRRYCPGDLVETKEKADEIELLALKTTIFSKMETDLFSYLVQLIMNHVVESDEKNKAAGGVTRMQVIENAIKRIGSILEADF
jgi:hypothetical protein